MITVCSVVYNDNTTGLFDLTMRSILRYTFPEPQFILCDNGNNDILKKYNKMSNVNIIQNTPKLRGGSNAHGESLNKIVSMVNTEYCAIVESDCVVICNLNTLVRKNKLVAIPKDKDLYHIFFLLGKTDRLKKVDFMPKNPANNKSYKAKNDVGARIADEFGPNDVTPLDFVDCKTNKGNFFSKSFQSDEVMLHGKTIACHFGRGSHIGGKAIRKGFMHPREQLEEWKSHIIKEMLK